jgi:hypothetical protein
VKKYGWLVLLALFTAVMAHARMADIALKAFSDEVKLFNRQVRPPTVSAFEVQGLGDGEHSAAASVQLSGDIRRGKVDHVWVSVRTKDGTERSDLRRGHGELVFEGDLPTARLPLQGAVTVETTDGSATLAPLCRVKENTTRRVIEDDVCMAETTGGFWLGERYGRGDKHLKAMAGGRDKYGAVLRFTLTPEAEKSSATLSVFLTDASRVNEDVTSWPSVHFRFSGGRCFFAAGGTTADLTQFREDSNRLTCWRAKDQLVLNIGRRFFGKELPKELLAASIVHSGDFVEDIDVLDVWPVVRVQLEPLLR